MIAVTPSPTPTSLLPASAPSAPASSPAPASPAASSAISSLAQELSAAAERAAVREASLSGAALGQYAERQRESLSGAAYQANKAQHDAEVPASADAARLARAEQATAFSNGQAANPFADLSREQLALIAYDDSASFTVNERRAAGQAAQAQESAWRQQASAAISAEYQSTGQTSQSLTQVQSHYQSLPAIEQAQYPASYATELQGLIDADAPPSPQQVEALATRSGQAAPAAAASPASPPAMQPSSSGLGYELMLERVFNDTDTEPPVAYFANGVPDAGVTTVYLTREDRALISDMYAYTSEQGGALRYVDEFAFQLAHYRFLNDGRQGGNYNDGHNYDSEGHQLSVAFLEEDAATAERILDSSAMSSTRIDQGFLRDTLDPGTGAIGKIVDFAFLEEMVTHFSDEGSDQDNLNDQFNTHQYIHGDYIRIVSEEVVKAPSEPDRISVDGVWTVTEKGKAKGLNAEGELIVDTRYGATSQRIEQAQNRYIMDSFFAADEPQGSQPEWLSSLLTRLREQSAQTLATGELA